MVFLFAKNSREPIDIDLLQLIGGSAYGVMLCLLTNIAHTTSIQADIIMIAGFIGVLGWAIKSAVQAIHNDVRDKTQSK